jgi:hypothetical protein
MTEFIALANHRKAVKVVMVENSRKFRRMQLEPLSGVLRSYGVDPDMWPAAAILIILSSISRHLRTDEEFGVDLGHGETIALVERQIRTLEGARGASHDPRLLGSTEKSRRARRPTGSSRSRVSPVAIS